VSSPPLTAHSNFCGIAIKEILENPKILIRSFGARSSLFVDEVGDVLNFRFELASSGTVTVYMPEISFPRPMLDVELENEFYNIIRRIYTYIIGETPTSALTAISDEQLPDQLVMEFLRDIR